MGLNLGRWLKGATRIRFDDRTGSNLLRNAATGAGALIGGPAGLAIAGVGNAGARALSPGGNFGNIVGAGLQGAGTAGALRLGGGLLRGALTRGAGGVSPIATGGGGGGAPPIATGGGLSPIAAGSGAPAAITGANVGMGGAAASRLAQPGALNTAARGLSRVGSFVGDHPDAVGMGLKGLGSIATSGTENRMNEAEIRALEQRTNLSAEEAERKKQQDAAMEPIRQALMLQLARGMGPGAPPAANPYQTPLPIAGG